MNVQESPRLLRSAGRRVAERRRTRPPRLSGASPGRSGGRSTAAPIAASWAERQARGQVERARDGAGPALLTIDQGPVDPAVRDSPQLAAMVLTVVSMAALTLASRPPVRPGAGLGTGPRAEPPR